MVFGNEFHETTRRREFKASHSVESLTSGSSDGESYSPKLCRERKDHLQRSKSLHQIIHEMSSSTKKLEEETSGLLHDMVSFRFLRITKTYLELFGHHKVPFINNNAVLRYKYTAE